MRSLATNREVATMAEAPVRTHVHHSFNIHLHVTPQITLTEQFASICSLIAKTSASESSFTLRVTSILTAEHISSAVDRPIPVIYVSAIGTLFPVGIFTPAIRATLLPFVAVP